MLSNVVITGCSDFSLKKTSSPLRIPNDAKKKRKKEKKDWWGFQQVLVDQESHQEKARIHDIRSQLFSHIPSSQKIAHGGIPFSLYTKVHNAIDSIEAFDWEVGHRNGKIGRGCRAKGLYITNTDHGHEWSPMTKRHKTKKIKK